ncbi:MAG: hypothetical protein WC673_01990 [Candidatus Paceibacterota bacterium]|jgi:hypothetical protein
MPNFFQKNKKLILAVVLVSIIAGPLALVPVHAYADVIPEAIAKALSFLSIKSFAFEAILSVVDGLANIFLMIAGLITAFAGVLFDASISFSLNIKDFLDKTPVINDGWKIIRDLANMFFIFILLYVAIKTILGDNPGKMLATIIITALLINFSMFFTKVAIDASNITALWFYDAIPRSGAELSSFDITDSTTWRFGLAAPFFDTLKIQTIFPTEEQLANSGATELVKSFITMAVQRILSQTVGVVLMLIAAFVFFAGAIMFVARTVILLFLLMVSPIAVASRLIPKLDVWGKWSGKLTEQLIFAPVFMAMLYLSIRIVQAPSVKALLGGENGSWAGALSGNTTIAGMLFGYLFIIGLLIATLIISKSVGATGATTMIGWGQSLRKGAQGWAGRNTFGATARGIADSDKFKDWASRHPTMGRAAFSGLGKVSSARFSGDRGGYDAAQKKKKESKEEFGEHLAKPSPLIRRPITPTGTTTPSSRPPIITPSPPTTATPGGPGTTSGTGPSGKRTFYAGPSSSPPGTSPASASEVPPVIPPPPIVKSGVDVEIEKILGDDTYKKVSSNERFMKLARVYLRQKFGEEIIKNIAKKITRDEKNKKDDGDGEENISEVTKKIRERIEDKERHDDIVSDLRKNAKKLKGEEYSRMEETINKSSFTDDEKKKLLDALRSK